MECELKMSHRRVLENRRRIFRETYEFVAVYASVTIRGDSFAEVCDQLLEKGFQVAKAKQIAEHTVRIPHKDKSRASAAVRRVERETE